ncbi:MAG: hypothetical protein K5989_05510 [Lachnospiraceae bacterium]|nr:hypothetical protein [Lachnospiraceae bacterium]
MGKEACDLQREDRHLGKEAGDLQWKIDIGKEYCVSGGFSRWKGSMRPAGEDRYWESGLCERRTFRMGKEAYDLQREEPIIMKKVLYSSFDYITAQGEITGFEAKNHRLFE